MHVLLPPLHNHRCLSSSASLLAPPSLAALTPSPPSRPSPRHMACGCTSTAAGARRCCCHGATGPRWRALRSLTRWPGMHTRCWACPSSALHLSRGTQVQCALACMHAVCATCKCRHACGDGTAAHAPLHHKWHPLQAFCKPPMAPALATCFRRTNCTESLIWGTRPCSAAAALMPLNGGELQLKNAAKQQKRFAPCGGRAAAPWATRGRAGCGDAAPRSARA